MITKKPTHHKLQVLMSRLDISSCSDQEILWLIREEIAGRDSTMDDKESVKRLHIADYIGEKILGGEKKVHPTQLQRIEYNKGKLSSRYRPEIVEFLSPRAKPSLEEITSTLEECFIKDNSLSWGFLYQLVHSYIGLNFTGTHTENLVICDSKGNIHGDDSSKYVPLMYDFHGGERKHYFKYLVAETLKGYDPRQLPRAGTKHSNSGIILSTFKHDHTDQEVFSTIAIPWTDHRPSLDDSNVLDTALRNMKIVFCCTDMYHDSFIGEGLKEELPKSLDKVINNRRMIRSYMDLTLCNWLEFQGSQHPAIGMYCERRFFGNY